MSRLLSFGEVTQANSEVCDHGHRTPSDNLAIGVLILLYAGACIFTWHKWGDLTIDCGREIWVPAAINQGKRLYFDIWYPYGPLIPYWHALLERIFGINLSVLYAAGLSIVALHLALVYRLSRTFLPVCLSFTVSFAFLAMAMQLNLFNYVLPYSYPAAYGALLFTTLIWLAVRDTFHEKRHRIAVMGVVAAAALLTKIEVGIGAYGLLSFAILLRAWKKGSWFSLVRDIGLCLPPFAVAAGVYGFLVYKSSLLFIFADNITMLPQSYFVQAFGHRWAEITGFSTSPSRLMFSIAADLVSIALVVGALRLCAVSRLARAACLIFVLGLCTLQIALMSGDRIFGWLVPEVLSRAASYVFFSPALFWSSVVLLLLSGWSLRHYRQRPEILAVVLLAAASLAIGVRAMTKIAPYGYPVFYCLLPYLSSVVLIYSLCGMLRIRMTTALWRGFAGFLCAGIVVLTLPEYSNARSYEISTERGSIVTDPITGKAFSEVLLFLNEATAHSKNFVVWPEENALYYFSRTNAPNRWHSLTPGLLPPGAETDAYLADLDRQRIQYVVLSSRSKKEYKTPVFGDDYNREVYAWLQRNYHPLRTMGTYERASIRWAAMIYERNSDAPAAVGANLSGER